MPFLAAIGTLEVEGKIHAVTGQMDGELFGQEGGEGLGKLIGVTGEASAGDRFAGGVLEAGQ